MALWCGNPGHRGFWNDWEHCEPSRPLQKVRKDFAHMQSSLLPLPLEWNWISVTSRDDYDEYDSIWAPFLILPFHLPKTSNDFPLV